MLKSRNHESFDNSNIRAFAFTARTVKLTYPNIFLKEESWFGPFCGAQSVRKIHLKFIFFDIYLHVLVDKDRMSIDNSKLKPQTLTHTLPLTSRTIGLLK